MIVKSNLKRHYSFFFSEKKYNIFGEEKNVSLKTRLHCITMDKNNPNNWREKRQEARANQIENDEKVENLLRNDESDGK